MLAVPLGLGQRCPPFELDGTRGGDQPHETVPVWARTVSVSAAGVVPDPEIDASSPRPEPGMICQLPAT